jgi:hypothetical protein
VAAAVAFGELFCRHYGKNPTLSLRNVTSFDDFYQELAENLHTIFHALHFQSEAMRTQEAKRENISSFQADYSTF